MFDRCIYFNLSTLSRRITKLWEQEFSLIGLAPSHGYLLFALAERPDANQKTLSEIMELDASTVTRFIDLLVQKGLITRERIGKGATYSLTESGTQMVTKIDQAMDKLFDQMRTTFGSDHFTRFVADIKGARNLLAKAT